MTGLACGWHHGADSKQVSSPQRRFREETGKKELFLGLRLELREVRGSRDGCGHGSP